MNQLSPQIEYATLASLKGSVKLEKLGMKRRGPQATPIARARLGLGKRAPHDEVIAKIEARMNELLELVRYLKQGDTETN